MNRWSGLVLLLFVFTGCRKDDRAAAGCNMEQVYAENAQKVTLANGIWGTVSFVQGDCIPVPATGSCSECPVQRTVRIYPYTLRGDATPSDTSGIFFEPPGNPAIAQTQADEQGFFQLKISPGHYSVAIVENGKLYFGWLDGAGGLGAITLTDSLQKANLPITYKAVF